MSWSDAPRWKKLKDMVEKNKKRKEANKDIKKEKPKKKINSTTEVRG